MTGDMWDAEAARLERVVQGGGCRDEIAAALRAAAATARAEALEEAAERERLLLSRCAVCMCQLLKAAIAAARSGA